MIEPTPCHELNRGLSFWDDNWLDEESAFHDRLAERIIRAKSNPRAFAYGPFWEWRNRMNAKNINVTMEDYLTLPCK